MLSEAEEAALERGSWKDLESLNTAVVSENVPTETPRRVTGQYLERHVRTPSPLPPRGRFL